MKYLNYAAIVGTLGLLSPLAAFAGTKMEKSVSIGDPVQVGTTHLKPGTYKVEWEGAGPAVRVKFLHNGKTVATAPATLRSNDQQIKQDDVIMDKSNATTEKLREIDFKHDKEALVFSKKS
jgi:hypothetical protein